MDDSPPIPVLTASGRTSTSHLEEDDFKEELAPPSEPAQPQFHPHKFSAMEIACHTALMGAGWCDAATGPLIPYIQNYYGIGYTTVSMIFIGGTVGSATGGFLNSYMTERFGLGRMMAIGAGIQSCGLALIIPAFPFPMLPFCYMIAGFGRAFFDAQANTFVANLPNSEHKLGYLHASYGFGGVVCPLAATAFASHGIRFSYFFAISTGIAMMNTCIVLYAFKFKYRLPKDDPAVVGLQAETAPVAEEIELEGMGVSAGTNGVTTTKRKSKKGLLRTTLTLRTTWVFAIFILVYVGAEVSMGGWIVSFMIDERHGGASAGYIASGFWSGIVVGRAILPFLNVRVGERRVTFFYLAIALLLEFAIWFSKSLVGNGVVVALVGVVLGPMFPICMSLCTKLLPRSLHSSGIGFIAAFGAAGGALFPFLAGALAQKYSTAALQPMLVVLFSVLIATWCFVPPVVKKVE